MTTKHRIIAGFTLLIVLLGLMAFLGFTSLQTASTNFSDYRRLANINVYASNLRTAVYEIFFYSNQFIQNRDPALVTKVHGSADRALAMLREIGSRAQRKESLALLSSAETLVRDIKQQMVSVQENLARMETLYTGDILPNMNTADKLIVAAGEGAHNNGNTESLYYQTILWQKLALARDLMEFVFRDVNVEAGRQVPAAFAEAEKAMQAAGKSMISERGKADYAQMHTAFLVVMKTVSPVVDISRKTRESLAAMEKMGYEMLAIATELNDISDGAMRTNGADTLASNHSAQTMLLVTSVAGLLLGVAFAVLTIILLVRTLTRMAAFAGDIAAGNFSSAVRVTERGEIGTMFAAMQRIPQIFDGVITRCNDIANDIASGLFRNRLDAGKLTGGFHDLAQSINTIADSYTHTIDNLPVGIVTLDRDRRTIFASDTGRKMVGDDAARAFGGSMPFLDESYRTNRPKSAESALTSPDNVRIDVAATAMPLKNLKGEAAGGLTVLTDISEIKDKQKIMLQVAGDASNVSDRVAAAAEQLAAQVEEISRGADVQRSRVESTASAMTQMNATVIEVARNAGQAAEQTEGTKSSAVNGAGLVRQVVGAINDVNVIGNKLHDNMQALGEKAENIGGVMGVISDIADQTNLLALNAAIEAARAGEAGRGFAVVADEVRKLAEKTMAATQEVGSNIDAIQQSARVNIEEVEHAVESVGKATELANASGGALEEIVHLAASSSEVVSSIATAAEQQSATSDEINNSIDEINRITGETASGMIQSSAAVQELSRMAQELRAIMQQLQ